MFNIQSIEFFDEPNFPGGSLSTANLAQVSGLFQDYKNLGINTVTIGWGIPVDENTGNIVPAFNNVPTCHVASLSEIQTIAQVAQQLGLNIILKPQAQTMDPPGTNLNLPDNIYSSVVGPNFDANTFLAQWATYMSSVGSLAQQIGAKMVVVGTENTGFDTSPYRSDWLNVISDVRLSYSGALSYASMSSNNHPSSVSFWDKLDVIGVDGYYATTTNPNPTYMDVLDGWTANTVYSTTSVNIVQELQALSSQYGKPLWFSEFGGQSYHGVVSHPAAPGPSNEVDWQEQEWLYQAMFQSMSQANAGQWFQGVNMWAVYPGTPSEESGAFAAYLANFPTDFDIRGKPAALVATSWFGANGYMGPNDTSFAGSIANDQIYLYGNPAASGQNPTSEGQTFNTTVSVTIGGNILNGQTQTAHFYVNGIDEGAQTLPNSPGTYVDPHGVIWTGPQSFAFTLAGLVPINEIKISLDGSVNIGGVENSQTFISSVTVDGVSLTQGTYYPLQGPSQQLTITTGGQYDGGYELIDASPWNSQLASRQIGTAADPIQADGGGGTDTVHVLGLPSEYTINGIGTSTVTLSEHSGLDQNAVLTDISYVTFQDGSVLALANGTWSPGSQPLIAAPAAAVEGSMYNAVGSSAEINNLMVNFLPPQETTATSYGLNPLVYGCEVLGLAFAFGNENRSTAFADNFGPANASMPSTTAGDSAFAAAASSAIFGSASTPNLVNVLESLVSSWKGFYTGSGIPSIASPTATQIDLAARGAAWGDMVGVALANNNLGPLSAEVNNFLNDVLAGTALYSAPLTSQPMASMTSAVAMIGIPSSSDVHLM